MQRNLVDYQVQYTELPFEETQVKYRKRKIIESLQKFQARTILEIGCGMEPLFRDFDDFEKFVVIEPCEKFFLHAQSLADKDTRIALRQGIVQDEISFLQQSHYDMILLSSLLHEIADCEGLLRAVRALCHVNTVVHINVPNALSFHRLLALEMGLIDSVYQKSATQQKMQQNHTFDVHQLATLVQRVGFKVVEQGSFFVKPFTHGQMAQLQSMGIATNQLLNGLYRMSQYLPDYGAEIFMNIQLSD